MATLARRADCLRSPNILPNRISDKDHHVPFLIIEAIVQRKSVLCLPLVSYRDTEIDQEALDDKLKMRGGFGWSNRPSYFRPKDGWLIPNEAFLVASFPERSSTQQRMRYARNNKGEIARLRSLMTLDIDKMVPVWPEPTTIQRRVHIEYDQRHRGAIQMSETWSAADSYGWVR